MRCARLHITRAALSTRRAKKQILINNWVCIGPGCLPSPVKPLSDGICGTWASVTGGRICSIHRRIVLKPATAAQTAGMVALANRDNQPSENDSL
jgi:hypothetical protein